MKKLNQFSIAVIIGYFFIFSNPAIAQTRTISGTIFNGITSNPISGIEIGITGISNSVTSDETGYYSIAIPDTMDDIKFSEFKGMDVLEVKELEPDVMDIYLMADNTVDLSLEELMKVKVKVSTSQSETVFHTPSTVSVIDHDMLNKYNFLSVAEMLQTIVGIDIYQSNLDDNITTSRGILQNYYANKVLVMIENIPTYQPIYGNTNLDRIDINDIERIEVLKGPASVLYGSNAYLGVINIILKKDKNGAVNIRLSSGYHRFGSSGANITLDKNEFKLFISANNGYEIQKPYPLLGKRQDPYNGDSVFMFQRELKSGNFYVLSSYKSFSILLNNYEYQHTHLGINPSFISGGGKPMTDRGTLIALKFNKTIRKDFNLIADLAYDYFKRDWASNQDASNSLMLSGSRIFESTKINYKLNSLFDIEAGVDFERRLSGNHVSIDVLKDTIIRSNLKNVKDIDEISAFTQLHIKTRFANVLAGIRFTNNSFSGGDFSGRVSAVMSINDFNSLKLIYGQSFRAPTMLELFFDHPTVIGNLNLKPEKANSFEIAYVYGKKELFFQSLIYYNRLDQLIQRFTPISGPPSEYQNLSSFEGYGYEFEGKYQNSKIINAFFNYTYMAGIGSKAESNYMHIPKNTFKFGVNKSFGNFFASVNGNTYSSVIGNPKLNIAIPAQFQMDLHFGFNHNITSKNIVVRHTLSAKNITDSKMLIPEYIRQTDNINSMATTGFGRRFLYILTISF